MKHIIAILASLALAIPTAASAGGGHWRIPDHHHRGGGGTNPWPFIAGAVVGGILVSAAKANESRVISSGGEAPVLVNGTWMQRTYRCVQDIVIDNHGDERLVQRCNYVYVPVSAPTN